MGAGFLINQGGHMTEGKRMGENGNGNGNARFYTLFGSGAALVLGVVIGFYADQATASDRFVTRAQYERDVDRLQDQLNAIEGKVDALLRRNP